MIKNNFISVEASAGSGKTHSLTKSYISLLLNFDGAKEETAQIQNILALTFANKATIEMKERIIETLKKISLGMDVKNITNDISLLPKQIQQNALTAINILISNYDNFNVRTIDSFINVIIKACALQLGFSPNYKILDSYKDYIDYSIDIFLDKIITNPQIEQFLDKFFIQFITDSQDSWSIKDSIEKKFKEFYDKDVSKDSVTFDDSIDYSQQLSGLSGKFSKICFEMTKIKEYEYLNGKYTKSIDKLKTDNRALFNLTTNLFLKEELPYKKDKQTQQSRQLNDLFEEAKKVIKEFFEIRSQHYYDNYIKIFNYIIDEFDNRAKKDSVLFLQDINRKVLNIFKQNTLLPEIYCRLSANFKDFLIDEFQDTNTTQWKTLKLIVEENLSQDGSFFYVGDKKQAIYGFRGSDFQIFDLPLKEFQIYNPKKITLDTNYRSCQSIVDFNNLIFSADNISDFVTYIVNKNNIDSADKYCRQLVEVFESSQQKVAENKKNQGYVEISYIEYDKEDDEEEKIKEYLYKTIENLKKRFDCKDITILCRWIKEVEQVGKWLLEKNINIESFKTLNIINSNIVKEMVSVLDFFNLPIDNLAFTSFITSSIFLKQTQLTKKEMLDFVCEVTLGTEKQNVLYVAFREKYPQIWKDYIEEFFNSVGFIAVYEFMVSIISKFKIIENFKQEANVILRFLEIISDFETQKQGLQNFIDYFKDYETNISNEKFFIKVPSNNAIKIMTIHKAKGLQFNVVVMPFFYIKQKSPENPFLVDNNNTLSFLYMKKGDINYSNYLKDVYYKAYFKNLSDELNVLYVGTTRAIYEMYALILEHNLEKEKKENKSLINKLIKQDCRIIGTQKKYETEGSLESSKNICLQASQLDDIVDLISDSSMEIYGKKHQDILLKGQIIHYALSLIETFNVSTFSDVIKKSIEQVSITYPNEDISWLENILTQLLLNKKISCFFDKTNEVINEKEFVDKFGNTIRIDKLVIKQDCIDIIDFKSSIYDEQSIKKQLDNYKLVVKDIYPKKKIKTYVIDIEKNNVVELK